MSNNSNNQNENDAEGYNNDRNKRAMLFNSNKVFTETLSPVTERQLKIAADLRAALIAKTKESL